ncbi:PKD-like domain-containing protein [Flavobacterium gilvum]|uniref:Fibronectin type-III domain-containing protein n=1 Tax=Flavobacterium gilvum TaxID=1492737 RepID=A0AAC9I3W0_9FLAO|nr:PKD-like domain-containing protein [Flavobacterium gilvum]AOW08931.1 hypothetical protein EM308_05080 [Flavobacterium gilvum]KFC60918.1 hypothetical protein FEM08_03080 [Flavobacterium gilvum]
MNRILLSIFLCLFFVNTAFSATITSTGNGNWGAASTWSTISRTGTISTTSSSKIVTGVGTSFTTELAVGSILYKDDGTTVIGTVSSITDNTHLTLVANTATVFSSQSYMAKIVPTTIDDVVISSGTTVTLDTTTASANSITVDGLLEMVFKIDITLTTQLIVVSSTGQIKFDHNTLKLPSGAAIYLENGSNSLSGSCNNNDELDLGGVHYAVCTGGGAIYSFAEVEAAGGVNNISAGSIEESQTVCYGFVPSTLSSTRDGAGSGTISYEWQTNESGSYVDIPGATGKDYSPPALTVSASYRRRTVSVIGGKTFKSAYTTPVTITVNPKTVITAPATGSVCSGFSYSSGAITSTGTKFDWTRAVVTGISNTAGSGTGVNNASGVTETLINTTTSAITVTYILTPRLASGCPGSPFNLDVTVNPKPVITAPATGSACSGVSYSSGAITSTGTTFDWTRAAVTGISNTAGSATGVANASGITETLINTTTSAITVTYVLTPKLVSGCPGSPFNLDVTVNPRPVITAPATSSVCSGVSYSSGAITSTGTTFDWTRAAVTGISNSAGSATEVANATGITETLINTTTSAITVTYILTPKLASGCPGSPFNLVVTVNPTPVAPVLSNITLGCNQTTATETWTAISGITNYRFDVSTDPLFGTYLTGYNNLSVSAAATSLAINGLSPGVTYYVRARSQSGCGTSVNSSVVTITVNSSPIKPIASATKQPTCVVSTGTITVTSPTGAGLSYSIDGTNYSNTSGIFNSVPAGDYYVTAKNASGCVSVASDKISLNVAGTTTWSGSSWDNGVPDATKRAVFAGNVTITAALNACSCQINSGVAVGVASGVVLTIENGLDVLSTGTLTFENNASLIQVNDAAINNGKIIYKRITSPMKNFDFTYWSSPVKDQVLNVLSPNTLWDKYYSFNNGNWKVEGVTNKMNPAGKGFIIRVPKPGVVYPNGEKWYTATYAQPVQFEGIPNNGSISIATEGTGMDNLIGNPYPSAIDADAFINANASVIGGALYFWTHNTAITQSGSFYVYNSNDYATYNLTGGAGTRGNFIDANNNGVLDAGETIDDNNKPNGKIAAGQSFFVISKASGDFVFKNSMRNSTAGSNSQFLRMAQTKKTVAVEKSRVWLNLSNSDGAFKQLLVGYITGATNEMDKLYDGISFDGNDYVDFYSVNKEDKLTIQGRALPFDKGDKVPLGYKTAIQGTFRISIDKVDGVLTNQTVFLEDNVTKAVHNLNDGPYSFTTAKGTFDNRFTLVYVDKNAPIVIEPPVVVNPPIVTEPPVAVEPPVVVNPPIVTEPPVAVEPPVVVNPPIVTEPPVAVEPPVVVNPPIVTEPPVAVEPPVVVNPPIVTEPPVAVVPPVVVNPPIVTEPPVAVEPPVVVNPPIVAEPPVAVDPPVVVNPPIVTEPPVAVEPPVVVNPPIVIEPPVAVEPPVVVNPPIVTEPPVAVEPPVVVNPPIVTEPPVAVEPPVVVNPPIVTEPPVVVVPPVESLDPTIEKPTESKNKSLVVSVKNHQIKINSFDKTMGTVLLYDLRGRKIFENTNVKSNEYVIQGLNSSDQFLIVMIQLTDGKWVTKEIIFKN